MGLLKTCIPGITAYIIELVGGWQIVIMGCDRLFISDEPHQNECSQWGIVLEGEAILLTGQDREQKQTLKKNIVFHIPARTPHCVRIKPGYTDITIFDGQRYPEELIDNILGERR